MRATLPFIPRPLLISISASALIHALALAPYHTAHQTAPAIRSRPGGAGSVKLIISSSSPGPEAVLVSRSGTQISQNSASNLEGSLTQSVSDLLRTIDYPSSAREMGMEGSVLVRIQIGRDGRVSEVTTLRSSGYGLLDQSAHEGIARWEFPRMDEEFSMDLKVNFRLTGEE